MNIVWHNAVDTLTLLGQYIVKNGHIGRIKEIHDSDYSEWREGPPLITRTWKLESHNIQGQTGRRYKLHSHFRGQLLCIESGLIQVKTEEGSWILPPQRAGWIPPDALHSVYVCSALNGRSLLFAPEICRRLPTQPCVILISEVLQALAHRTIAWSKTDVLTLEQKHILAVIIDEIKRTRHESLYLPMPKDPRLERITQAMLDDPGSMRTVDQWAAIGSMSSRTLRRLMRSETGMGFGEWRQQAQLTHALEMLARGVSVADVADALGYASPSNFIAMFRRVFGDSPAHYFSSRLHLQQF